MNYRSIYNRLIARARRRSLFCYSERHHVKPRCLGGSNSPSNIVRLTPEEHYVAHQLLVKIHPGNVKLLWAAMNMTGGNSRQKRSNKVYGWLRRKFSKAISERKTGVRLSKSHCESISQANIKRFKENPFKHSAETKLKMSLASKGRQKSEDHKKALSLAKLGKKYGPRSEKGLANLRNGHKKAAPKLSLASLKRYESKEAREKHSARMKQWWADRKVKFLASANTN